jgi:hypothetical protein
VPFALTGPEVLGLVDATTLQRDQTVFVASQNSDTTVTTGNPRTIHSAAGDPANKQIILPIPAVGGNAPQFGLPAPGSTLCDKHGTGIPVLVEGPTTPTSLTGCIAVLAAPLNNDQLASRAKERDNDDKQQ